MIVGRIGKAGSNKDAGDSVRYAQKVDTIDRMGRKDAKTMIAPSILSVHFLEGRTKK